MKKTFIGLVLGFLVFNVFFVGNIWALETIDFEGILTNITVDQVFGDGGSGPITVDAVNPRLPEPNAAVIFDSAYPTGGDFDLGTPNNQCRGGGPGNGTSPAVGPGGEFENCAPLGKVLIIQNVGCLAGTQTDCPDDLGTTAIDGAIITLDFSELWSVTLEEMTFLDIDGNGPDPRVELFDASDILLGIFPIPNQMPNNGAAIVDLGPTADVAKMVVYLNGSGAIDNIVFEPTPLFSLGDRVWYDQDQDGIQDPNEPGLKGATVDLYNNATCSGTPIAQTTTGDTGPDGFYLFTDLLPGDYCVQFGNIPAGWSISPANQGDGTDDSKANGSAQIPNIFLTADDPDEDMGIYVPGTLGDDVRCISTGDPLAAITVTLFEDFDCSGAADGPAIATTETDATGFYQFTGLEVALFGDPVNKTCYIVEVDTNDADLGTCNVPIPPTVYNPPLDSNNPDDPNNDFEFELPPLECNLILDKKCSVVPPPRIPGDLCDNFDKPQKLTMGYTGSNVNDNSQDPSKVDIIGDPMGASPVQIMAGDKLDMTGRIYFNGTIALGDSFIIDATLAGEPDLESTTFVLVKDLSGNLLQTIEFHTSCSQPLELGDQFGSIQLMGFLDKVGDNAEIPPPPEPADNCMVEIGAPPGCETEGKPSSLTFRVTGETCAASENTQGSKFECTDLGAINALLPVQIVMLKDADKIDVVPNPVSIGDMVTISRNDGNNFSSETILEILQGGVAIQSLNIHTSCSAPLAVGDSFGSLELLKFDGQAAAAEVIYFYEITNNGDNLSGVTITDDQLGFISGPFDLLKGETKIFEKTVLISETTVNKATALGKLGDHTVCEDSDTVTVAVNVVEPCAICKGGTTELTFSYLGTTVAEVVVYNKDSADPNKVLFSGLVQQGDEFTVTPPVGDDKLNNDISIYVDGVFNTEVHTSCSKPIGPNAVFGDFLVVEARSKDNGLMCPLDPCDPAPLATLDFHDKEIRWNVTNNGDLGLEIKRISISWPEAAGALDEIKRDGDKIHNGDFAPPSAVIDSGWEGNQDKRTIKPGETDTLKFKFKNDVETIPGTFSIVVEFTAVDCSISIDVQR